MVGMAINPITIHGGTSSADGDRFVLRIFGPWRRIGVFPITKLFSRDKIHFDRTAAIASLHNSFFIESPSYEGKEKICCLYFCSVKELRLDRLKREKQEILFSFIETERSVFSKS